VAGAKTPWEVQGLWRGDLNRESPQARGLGLWYPMQEPIVGGTTILDRSGSGYHGTINNGPAPVLVSQRQSKALQSSSGSGTYVQATSVPWGSARGVSVAFWVRMDALTSFGYLWSLNNLDSSAMMSFAYNPGGYFYYYDAAVKAFYWNPSAGDIAHVVVVFESDSAMRFYVNGRDTAVDAPAGNALGTATLNLFRYSGGNYADISLWDFRVYTRALSAAEAWTIYDPRTRYDLYNIRRPRRSKGAAAVAADPVGRSVFVRQAVQRAAVR